MNFTVALVVLGIALLNSLSSFGQTTCLDSLKHAVAAYNADRADATLSQKLRFQEGGRNCLVALILSQADARQRVLAQIAQIKAAFQQSGSSSGDAGSTNLVSKGITAEVLSAAAEYGALTESTSGNTVTLQGTLGGLPALLGRQSILPVCSSMTSAECINLKTINALSRISYGIGFDTSSNAQAVTATATSSGSTTSAQPATFTASTHTLNSITGKIVTLRGSAANSTTIATALNKLASTAETSTTADEVIRAAQTLDQHCPEKPNSGANETELAKWQESTRLALTSLRAGQSIDEAWKAQGPLLIAALNADGNSCAQNYLSDAIAYASAFSKFVLAENSLYESQRAAPVLSFEYDYNSPTSQPTYSTIRGIFQISNGDWTGTLNAAGSFYNAAPSTSIPGTSRTRDFQVAAEAAYNFGKSKSGWLGNSTASFAYYYQDQTSPAILNVTPGQPVSGVTISGLSSNSSQVYAQKGVINVGQAKFTLIPSNWNINIPVSVTWSNRTELVTNSVWRGQLGISYDFDSLFSKSK